MEQNGTDNPPAESRGTHHRSFLDLGWTQISSLLCQPHKLDDDVARGVKAPRVEQIFGSSATANAAHHILWVMRKFFQKGQDLAYERAALLYVLKARNDKTGKVDISFDPEFASCSRMRLMSPSRRWRHRSMKDAERRVKEESGEVACFAGPVEYLGSL